VPIALRILLPVLIVAVAAGVFRLLVATKPQQEPPQVRERVWRVEVEPAAPQRRAPELELYGRVETPDLLRAAAPAPARVVEVRVRDGDRVSEGQVLVRLDERDFRSRIAQAEADVRRLEAEIESERNRAETDRLALVQERRLLAIARDAVDRQERLKTQQVGAEQALDEAEQAEALQALAVSNREQGVADHPSRLRALESQLASAQARLDELELEFERATVVAPFDGVVAGVDVSAGDQVAANTVLLRLYPFDTLEVRARIPAPYQGELLASRVDEALGAVARVGDREIPLTLDRVAGEADPSGVDGLFRVVDAGELLRPGQMLTLRMRRPPRDDTVAVPFRAVYGGDRLYKVEEGRMVGVDVESLGGIVGADGEERLLVRSPRLGTGDLIITTHMPNAVEGLRVEMVSDKAAVARATGDPGDAGQAVQ
jgi:multidrug efflux pump subunit AcrA (membrane-fusion protein)